MHCAASPPLPCPHIAHLLSSPDSIHHSFSHPQASRDFAAAASERLGLRVFPYSIFHIFFEQYLTIGGEALTLLGSGELPVAPDHQGLNEGAVGER